jgi:hypothetical protein
MQCPVCNKPIRKDDRECEACGEVLQPWRTIEFYGSTLRQRGLALAASGDHLGALLSFFEAALANPLDGLSLVDAARALVHLERLDDAERLLAGVRSPDGLKAAAALKQAIAERRRPPAPGEPPPGSAPEPAAEEEPPLPEPAPPAPEDEPILAVIVEDEPAAPNPTP